MTVAQITALTQWQLLRHPTERITMFPNKWNAYPIDWKACRVFVSTFIEILHCTMARLPPSIVDEQQQVLLGEGERLSLRCPATGQSLPTVTCRIGRLGSHTVRRLASVRTLR
ncbi:hypothetical protein MRX96_003998 [Rhipicephalus microplus]